MKRLRILMSFQAESAPNNPYLAQLVAAVQARASVAYFDWDVALKGSYDVLHVHWPESLLKGRSVLFTARRRLAFLLLLRKCRRDRIAIVRTLHNLRAHEDVSRVDSFLLDLMDRQTAAWIVLNESTPLPYPGPAFLIPHGHYQDWYRPLPDVSPIPGRLVFFGLIRRYKGVPALLTAFAETSNQQLSLRVLGKPRDAGLADEIDAAVRLDARASADLQRVADPDLVCEILQAELVVLPYQEMHNSGAVLLALSLGRPVLVPDSAGTQQLAAEVGESWVVRYSGGITSSTIELAVRNVRSQIPLASFPNLESRDWATAGEGHIAAYEAGIAANQ